MPLDAQQSPAVNPPPGKSRLARIAAAIGKSSGKLWDSVTVSIKHLVLFGSAALLISFAVQAFRQDLAARSSVQIEFSPVPDALKSEVFDQNNAAQILMDGIQEIELQAQTAVDGIHPALTQADAINPDLQNITIPETGLSLQQLQGLFRYIIPWLRPHTVTGRFEEYGNKFTLQIALDGKPIYLPPEMIAHDLATAKSMLFQPGKDDNAAFRIVQVIQPLTAISALNSWGNVNEATGELAAFSRAPQNQRMKVAAETLLGFIQIEQGSKTSETSAVKSLTLAGDQAMANANLCYIYQDTGFSGYDPGKAIAHCRRAIELDPNLASPYLHLGVLYKFKADDEVATKNPASQTDFQKALEDDQKVLTGNPVNISAHSGLGDVLGDPGFTGADFACSIYEYGKALDLKPDYSIAMLGLANSYSGVGDWSDAASYYKKALAQDSSLSKIGNFVATLPALEAAPENPQAINASKTILAADLKELQGRSPRNPTLENKIFTEMEILSLPARTPNDSTCVPGPVSASVISPNPA